MKLSCVMFVATFALASPPARLGAQHGNPRDDAAFEAVVRYAAASAAPAPVRVDPRPFLLGTGFNQIGTGRPVAKSRVTNARRAVLARLRIDTVDALAAGMNATCPSAMAVGMSDDTTEAVIAQRLRGCPRSISYVLAVGLPHAVQALQPPTDSDPCFQVKSCWTVRVQESYVTPVGANMTVDDYFLERSGSAWRVIRKVGLMIVE